MLWCASKVQVLPSSSEPGPNTIAPSKAKQLPEEGALPHGTDQGGTGEAE